MNAEGLAERIVEMAVVRPGDALVVKVEPTALSKPDEVRDMADRLHDILGEGFKVVVMAGQIEVSVVRGGGS